MGIKNSNIGTSHSAVPLTAELFSQSQKEDRREECPPLLMNRWMMNFQQSLSTITHNPELPPSFRQGSLEGSSIHLLSYSPLFRGFSCSFKWEESWCGAKREWPWNTGGTVATKAMVKNVMWITSWITPALVPMKIKKGGEAYSDFQGSVTEA